MSQLSSARDGTPQDALAAIEADYPGWRCWQAVIPALFYARRPNSSPPLVVRSATVEQLRAEVHRAERHLRENGHYR
jgi:hypothetical protein